MKHSDWHRDLQNRIAKRMTSEKKDLHEDVINFFNDNPNPTDEMLHDWAEEKGYDVHEVEEEVYKLATSYVELLEEGLADEENVTEDDVDKEELAMGIEVELEHTPNKDVAKEIALDHLAEMPDYYTKLKEMEGH